MCSTKPQNKKSPTYLDQLEGNPPVLSPEQPESPRLAVIAPSQPAGDQAGPLVVRAVDAVGKDGVLARVHDALDRLKILHSSC